MNNFSTSYSRDPDTIFPKETVTENNAPKKISHIQFGLFQPKEMHRLSEFEVCNRSLFQMPTRQPAPYGVLDSRLGVSDKKSICQTCRRKLTDCAGHYGHIRLELPVFHIGYFNHTLKILQSICKSCSRVLLAPAERAAMLKKIRNVRLDALGKLALYKRVVERCKKCDRCLRCGAVQGVVKKVAGAHTLKLVHERYRAKFSEEDNAIFVEDMEAASGYNKELSSHLSKAQEDLPPTLVHGLFRAIPDEDAELLWMSPDYSRPENLILLEVLVPPVPIRPSVAMDVGAGSNEDDLTMKLQEIIDVNSALKMALERGASIKMIMENWDFLQYQVAQFINGDAPGLPKPLGGNKPPRGLCQRLKGKTGRFRGNLSGKRVDFSGRTVISPDPNLRVDQVGVPLHVAKTMTYPEKVTRYNIEKLRKLVLNGPSQYPGANYIRPASAENDSEVFIKSLLYGNRERLAETLRAGDVVERHMENGDIVLFNRQPSLHKMSIMAHHAKVMPWRTFRFNECVCAPYNADFDGDEMNMHLPQTEEARAEAINLMGVVNNLTTPKNGEPLVSATQDFLTGAYLLTQKDNFFTREGLCQVLAYLSDADEHIDVPIPCILKPIQLWSGKQVSSLLVRPNKDIPVLANFELKERNYSSGLTLCKNDGYVFFRNSIHISGNLCKKTLGDGSKKSMFYVLIRDHGPHWAARCMNRLAKLCARYLGYHRGFSIGIKDVTPTTKMAAVKANILRKGFATCEEQIAAYRSGKLALKPGCNALQSLESELNGILGRIRESAGKTAMVTLPWVNAPRVMAECGSKGSPLNISQMMACVGQQAVGGKRIENGFVSRTLPHFPAGSLTPSAKGFVANSFFSGLTATEFFFHTMGGREGLVDTAVKTAETGYMARRLMKALEDLSFQYDSTVRNSEQMIVQFIYGDDCLHPQMMEGDERPVDFERIMTHTQASEPNHDEEWMSPQQILTLARNAVGSQMFQSLLPNGKKFLEEVEEFFSKYAQRVTEMMNWVGCEVNSDCLKQEVGSKQWRKENTDTWHQMEQWNNRASDIDIGTLLLANTVRLTKSQMKSVLKRAHKKYLDSCVEPGEAVGAIGAQSISEPGTQMTLKTFHFAGVASMNVTLGVPRLREIINAAKNISTPIITASLVRDDNKTSARIVKGEIEKTTLGQIASYIKEVYASDMAYISVKLDMNAIQQLHLNIDARSVRQSILKGHFGVNRPKSIKLLKDRHVLLKHGRPDKLRIIAPETKDSGKADGNKKAYFMLQALKGSLPEVIVKGIPSVSRAVINEEDAKGDTRYHLLVEGYGLSDVMSAPGVDGTKTRSNHIIEVEKTLGIEAARIMIQSEISYIMSAYGIDIDKRHLMLLSDVMTFKGEVLGITRFGVSKMRESVLMLASFEKTTDHLFDAAVHGRTDAIVGVSECIIMGIPIPVGTGLFKLLLKVGKKSVTPTKRSLVFDKEDEIHPTVVKRTTSCSYGL